MKKCLDSVYAQSFSDYEVLVIDDGSTDNSASVYKEYVLKDARFHSYYQENKGVSAARNRGFELSQGDFVVCLDSDDCYKPEYLQSFFDIIQMYVDRDHFWCGYVTLSNDPEYNGEEAKLESNERIIESSYMEVMSLHEAQLLASPCNKAYRNSIIKAYMLRMKEGFSLGEDLLFNLEYLDKSNNPRIVVINETLYEYYCFSEDSLNHKYRSDLSEINDIIADALYYYLNKWQVSDVQLAKFYSTRYYMYVNEMLNTFQPQDKRSRKDKIQANNQILRSRMFKDTLRRCGCHIHPFYRAAYKTGDYRFVHAVDKLVEWKRNIKII